VSQSSTWHIGTKTPILKSQIEKSNGWKQENNLTIVP
jgi:hypothetical protein